MRINDPSRIFMMNRKIKMNLMDTISLFKITTTISNRTLDRGEEQIDREEEEETNEIEDKISIIEDKEEEMVKVIFKRIMTIMKIKNSFKKNSKKKSINSNSTI